MAKGSDRRRYGTPAVLGRKEEERDSRERILVVCEGECTEPSYIDGLRRDLSLPNIEVAGKECGSDPESVVVYALERYAKDSALDRVYCVIDRDEHSTFASAQGKARQAKRGGIPIQLVVSYPSFEFWYVLHFGFSRSPFARTGNRSPGDNVISRLKQEYPNYEKNDRQMWDKLSDKLEVAVKNARLAAKAAREDLELNPSTDVYKMVEAFLKMAGRPPIR